MKEGRGISLISLVVTIIVILIISSISITTLFGSHGIISMAIKAKKEYETAEEQEKLKLASVFDKNYVDYNGNLKIEGKQLVNKYGEELQLRGFSTSNADINNFDFNYYYNEESIQSIKEIGSNLLRLVALPRHYVNGDDVLEQIYKVIDCCIEKEIYVIIDWHVIKEGDPNIYKEYAISFFDNISKKYKDSPNLIYEICNEPNTERAGYEVTWEMISSYANEVIPIIRNNSKDSIIIVGTPEASTQIDCVIGSKLNYDNIMYSLHLYPSGNYSMIDRLKIAMENNIPIFVTEWSCYESSLLNEIDNIIGNEFVNTMANYKISWAFFELGDDEHITSASVVQGGKWNNTLEEDILTQAGKYIKDVFIDIAMETGNGMMKYKEEYAFWNEKYRNLITSICFKNEINNDIIKEAKEKWDMSYVEGNNKVIAYILSEENNEEYKLEISANGPLIAPKDASYLFSNFKNLKEIDFTNFDTTYIYNMSYMLYNNPSLEKINFSDINTKNANYMGMLFAKCTNLQQIDVNKFNTSNVLDMTGMFSECSNLELLDLQNFDTSNVTKFDKMFYNCRNLSKINMQKFNTISAKTMVGMFQNCTIITDLDISSFDMSKVTDISYMFAWSPAIQNINMKNAEFDSIENCTMLFKQQLNTVNILVKDMNAKDFIDNCLKQCETKGNVKY